MNEQAYPDKSVIDAYRRQTAPPSLRRAIIEQFETRSPKRKFSWRAAALASFTVCAVVGLLLNTNTPHEQALQPRFSLNPSMAHLGSLPSLSSIGPRAKFAVPSIGRLKPMSPIGQYRQTINLTNEIL